MKNLILSFLLISSFILLISCDEDTSNTVTPDNPLVYKTPKYVIFLIGDGMAIPQINLTEAALVVPDFKNPNIQTGIGPMNIRRFPVAGMATTHAENRYITGSAAAATALATGYKTTINTISKTGDWTQNLETMAEMARDKGMRVGIVTSVSIDHATPAAFYAHEDTRKNLYSIASQMSTSNFDFFAGGYAVGNYEKYGPQDIETKMTQAGYTITKTRGELESVQPGTKCWAYNTYDGEGALNYAIDRKADEISLTEFSEHALRLLDNDKGFFLMIEAGKVDWACHANDAVTQTYDMLAFDKTIAKVLEFYENHKEETLIVLTGDHECGGLSIGFANTGYNNIFDILKYQKVSYQAFSEMVSEWKDSGNMTFEKAMEKCKEYFGLGDVNKDPSLELSEYELTRLKDAFNKSMTGESIYTDDEISLFYNYYDPFTVTITHFLNQKAGIDWTSYSHTGIPVPVFAVGQGEAEFTGYYDNTDVAKKIIKIAKLK